MVGILMDFSIQNSRDMGLEEARCRLKQSLRKYQHSITQNNQKEMMISHCDFCQKQHDFEYLYNRYLLIESKKNRKLAKLI